MSTSTPTKHLAERVLIRFPKLYAIPLYFMGKYRAPFPPEVIKIETTNACNGKCIYCPRDKMTRKIGFIEEDLYRKVVDECGAEGAKCLHLQNYGEPLLDKNMPSRIAYAKEKGISYLMLFSNGLLLTRAISRKLIDVGLDEISISLDSALPEEHSNTRVNLDYTTVTRNILGFLEERDKNRGKRTKVTLTATVKDMSSNGVRQLREKWNHIVDEIVIQPLHNWGGEKHLGLNKIIKPCSRLWLTMTVLVDGKISLCCVDYNGEYILGDVSKNTLKEIWNSNKYVYYRKKNLFGLKNSQLICSICNLPNKDSPLWTKKILITN